MNTLQNLQLPSLTQFQNLILFFTAHHLALANWPTLLFFVCHNACVLEGGFFFFLIINPGELGFNCVYLRLCIPSFSRMIPHSC